MIPDLMTVNKGINTFLRQCTGNQLVMLFVTDVLIGGSFADWFTHYSLDKNYNFDPSFSPKISLDHVSCDAKIFIGPRGFLSDMSGGPTNFREHWLKFQFVCKVLAYYNPTWVKNSM